MKYSLKRLIACALICLLLLSAAACEKDKPVKDNPGSNVTSSDTSSGEESKDGTTSEDGNVSSEDESDDNTESDSSLPDDDNDINDYYANINQNRPLMPPVIPGASGSDGNREPVEDVDESIDYIDETDKPWVSNPAGQTHPMSSKYDKEANALRKEVLNYADKLPSTVTGTVWYVSNDGDDLNEGTSKDKPLKTILGLNFYKNDIKSGDAVLFERGDVFRGTFEVKSGVYYGAYGKGDKPCIYASDHNYARAVWTKKHNNLWILEAPFESDVGLIVFDHGKMIANKKTKNFDLESNGDFWCDKDANYKVYFYYDKDPSKEFKSIEIGTKENIIRIPAKTENVTIENLTLKYTGGHAISAGKDVKGITVKGCEIGYIGGSYLESTLRYGNGIEFYEACTDVVCEYNWIYEIYDSGLTYQGGGENVYKNVLFNKNLIEYCGMGSIEYWLSSDETKNYAENITYSNNIMRFAGYCWGGDQRPDKGESSHIRSDVTCRNAHKNFLIINNIFDQSSQGLLKIGGTSDETNLPTMSGNIYAQNNGGSFGIFGKKYGLTFDNVIEELIKKYVKDNNPIIAIY